MAVADKVRVRMEAVGWGGVGGRLLAQVARGAYSMQYAKRRLGDRAASMQQMQTRRPRAGYKENLLHMGIQNENTTCSRQLSLTLALNAATPQKRCLLWHLGALRSRRHQDIYLCQGAPGA